mmetsp:Transcript_20943/g.59773  ORF Transcript_20943/g.59773 Transcript_20943/m.59773 type:complete len:180 (+) Transcript_20943:2363-2902(+)
MSVHPASQRTGPVGLTKVHPTPPPHRPFKKTATEREDRPHIAFESSPVYLCPTPMSTRWMPPTRNQDAVILPLAALRANATRPSQRAGLVAWASMRESIPFHSSIHLYIHKSRSQSTTRERSAEGRREAFLQTSTSVLGAPAYPYTLPHPYNTCINPSMPSSSFLNHFCLNIRSFYSRY